MQFTSNKELLYFLPPSVPFRHVFLNFSNCRQSILAWFSANVFLFSTQFVFSFQASFPAPCPLTLCGICLKCNSKHFFKLGVTMYCWQTLLTLERVSGAFFRKRDESFFRGKFWSPALCSLWENHGRSEGIHNGNPKLWKESMWETDKKKYLVVCESMGTKLKEHSLDISKTLNLNNFETESQKFTVIVIHKILVPLGEPRWFHCFTIFTGL